jgi:hypothetical protein
MHFCQSHQPCSKCQLIFQPESQPFLYSKIRHCMLLTSNSIFDWRILMSIKFTIKHHLTPFLSKVLNTTKIFKSKLVKLLHVQSHLNFNL